MYVVSYVCLQMCMSFVDIIMSIYKKYKEIIEKIFQSDKTFTGALDKACIHIVNYSPDNKSYKSSELVRLLRLIFLRLKNVNLFNSSARIRYSGLCNFYSFFIVSQVLRSTVEEIVQRVIRNGS